MTTETTERIGREISGPGRAYFEDVVLDNVLDAMLELTAALWTCQDRTYVLERAIEGLLAESHGRPDLEQLIQAWQPTPADQERRRLAREALVESDYRSFARRPLPRGAAGEGTP